MPDKSADPNAFKIASAWRRRILALFALFTVVLPIAYAVAVSIADGDNSRTARVFGFWNAMARMASLFIALGLALNWVLLVVAWFAPRRIARTWPAVGSVRASVVGALAAMTIANLGNVAVLGLFALLFFPGKTNAVLNRGSGMMGALMVFAAPILCGGAWAYLKGQD